VNDRTAASFKNARIERVLRIMTPEQAESDDAAFWAGLGPSERLDYLERLRSLWMTEDERRLMRVLAVIEVA
jgi:hypothetical protein